MSNAVLSLVIGLAVLCGGLVLAVGWLMVRLKRRDAPVVAREPEAVAPEAKPAPAPEPVTITYTGGPVADPTMPGLSIEANIDIDQQAEFLLVLGQDEEAIDLLLEHLRGTGGTSPLPYLRLMQIYRRREDSAAYERTRERFNQRFNALAPQWQSDPATERSLQGYPQALAEVQGAWHAPLDAMAVIESLLFRRGSESERFDLPAYEELLFLYWLTRELQQQQADAPPSQVDVLLPIEDGHGDVSVIQRAERKGGGSYDSTAVIREVELPEQGARVDLDLSTVPAEPDVKL